MRSNRFGGTDRSEGAAASVPLAQYVLFLDRFNLGEPGLLTLSALAMIIARCLTARGHKQTGWRAAYLLAADELTSFFRSQVFRISFFQWQRAW